jgi:phage tail sheath gpL-like
MAKAIFAANKFTETWIGVFDDNGAGVAATGTITVTGPATAAGTISLYLGGTLISVPVASGDAAEHDRHRDRRRGDQREPRPPGDRVAATNVVT